MHPVCSFCGDSPAVAWFEGPRFRNVVDSADEVRTGEAWVACAVCRALVEANDREALVERDLARQLRRDTERGRERSLNEEVTMRRTTRSHLEKLFWAARSG
jgi:thiamine phosphate synthase YjbQ (UPF0047 family)